VEDRGPHQVRDALDAGVDRGGEVPAGTERDKERQAASFVEEDPPGREEFGVGAQLLGGSGGGVGDLAFGREELGVHRGLERGVAEALRRMPESGGGGVAACGRVRQRSLETGHRTSLRFRGPHGAAASVKRAIEH
jgi:hypothetical protein